MIDPAVLANRKYVTQRIVPFLRPLVGR
jgi:hypothetical protein